MSAAGILPGGMELLGWRPLRTGEWSPAGAAPPRPPARERRQHRVRSWVVPHIGLDAGSPSPEAFLWVFTCRRRLGLALDVWW